MYLSFSAITIVGIISDQPDLVIVYIKSLRIFLQAASHFFDPSESAKTSLYHRLLHVSSDTVLQENSSLSQAGIKDNGW